MATSLRAAIIDARASAVPASEARPTLAVVRSIGRVEAWQMLRHPSFLLSMAFSLLLFRGAIGASSETGLELNVAWLVGGLAVGTLIACVLTANVATVRARRDRLGELYGSMPAPPEARTAGLLAGLTMGIGGFGALVGALAWFAFERLDRDLADGADLFLYAQFLLTILALGALGVAVGRWVPTVLGGPMIVIAHVFTGLIWIVPWIAISSSGIDAGWHIAYLVAAIVAGAALAFLRDRRTLGRSAVALTALGIAVVAAVQQQPVGGF